MKKRLIIAICLLAALLLVVAGCKPAQTDETQVRDIAVSLSETTLKLDVLDKVTLTATVTEDGAASEHAVTWSTDNDKVAKVENGTVLAVGAGEATITAAVGDKTAQCKVQVSAVVHPTLTVKDTVEVGKGTTAQVLPTVRFKTNNLDAQEYGITFTYTVADPAIATVTDKGIVSGVAVGETELTVKASLPLAEAAGIAGQLSAVVKVTVVPDYTLQIGIAEGYTEDIYLQEATVGEDVFKASVLLEVLEGLYEDQDIKDQVVFCTSDEKVAVVSKEGLVTLVSGATENDTVEVWAKYVTPSEGEVNSNRITITVRRAILEKELENDLLIDLSAGGKVDATAVFGSAMKIVDVYDSADAYKISLWNSSTGGIDASLVTELGERELVIVGEKIACRVNAVLATKVITTAQDFADIFFSSTSIANIKATGYYVLGNNIDASEIKYVGRGWNANDGYGLVGTFDGRGYTMDGFDLPQGGGIFGVISSRATLKNVAFTNVRVHSNGHAEILGYGVYGRVENVFVGVTELNSTMESTNTTVGLFAQASTNNVLKNIVVINSAVISCTDQSEKWGILEASTNKGAWENVLVVSADRLFGGDKTAGDKADENYAKGVERFSSIQALLESEYYKQVVHQYPGDIWNRSTMTFKTSGVAIAAELNAMPKTLVLSVGESIRLVDNYNLYTLTTNSSKLKLENGCVVASQAIASTEGATVTVAWGATERVIQISTKREQAVDVSYDMNTGTWNDLTVTGLPINSSSVKVWIPQLDGKTVPVNTTCVGGKLIIPGATLQTYKDRLATGEQTWRIEISGQEDYYINDVKLIWVINNADELLRMKEHLLVSGDSYYGYLALGADIDLNGVTVANTGLAGKDFTGIFDGRNHVISNIAAKNANVGLLGDVSGIVCNLRVVNATVSTNTAAVIGGALTGTAENIYVQGSITGDAMKSTSNLANFGCGLLAGRILETATVKNTIVELTDIADGLLLGTAFGKLHQGAPETVFTNCYAVGAPNCTFAKLVDESWKKLSFTTGGTNRNFADMDALWNNSAAAKLAQELGLKQPPKGVTVDVSLDLNGSEQKALELSGLPYDLSSLTVYAQTVNGGEVALNATCVGGKLIITAESLEAVKSQLATGENDLRLDVGGDGYHVWGVELVWVINDANELLRMKEHLVPSGNTYSGSLALGADINLQGVIIANTGLAGKTFTGTFDGRNHTLSNLAAKNANVGLLGDVSGTVKNLSILKATVSTNTAAVIGGALSGTAENIYVQGSITGDGMSATSNLTNFGSGLLAGRILSSAKVDRVIVELEGIADGLRLATAFGKLHDSAPESVFTNCYAVGANAVTFMQYVQDTWTKLSFTAGKTNYNYDTLWHLWQNENAKALAVSLGIAEPAKPGIAIEVSGSYDMNSADSKDFVVSDSQLSGTVSKPVTVQGTDIVLENATLENGRLTVPAADFKRADMPSGKLTLVVELEDKCFEITGEFVWVVSSWAELAAMDDHMVVSDDGSYYTGSIALGADIALSGTERLDYQLWNQLNAAGQKIQTYNGTFDGRGHTISKLNASVATIGLFCNLGKDGLIRDLRITDATVSSYTAALVGGALEGTVENVYVQGSITGDGVSTTSNLTNFGSGLLAARINGGAKICNVIVEVTKMAEGLRLATAFGKLHNATASESSFTNCYAVNAEGYAYMAKVEDSWTKLSFTAGATNEHYDTLWHLWQDEEAKALAVSLGIAEPTKPAVSITVENAYDMNSAEAVDFVVTDSELLGTMTSGLTVKGTEIVLENAVLENGKLTVPAAAFQLGNMPSGELTLVFETESSSYEITGQFIWVINNADELLKMKEHMSLSGTTYTGLMALGADIDLNGVTVANTGMGGKVFAGTFDGRGHTLSNLAAKNANVGLLGDVSGMVKNLIVKNATVSSYTAAVVGGALTGTVENIYVQGSVTADGMSATSNLANFGSGLLVGRIQGGAKINNVIVEVTDMADGLRLATAFGKLHNATATESIFTNCYAVNAAGTTFMVKLNNEWTKCSFTEGATNANFASLWHLWKDETARALAESFGITEPAKPAVGIEISDGFDMNTGKDLVIHYSGIAAQADPVTLTMDGSTVTLENAVLEDGKLTVPAASFAQTYMPSGQLTLRLTTEDCEYAITGEFVWTVKDWADAVSGLAYMKNHMLTSDGKAYTGSIALGADIDLTGKIPGNFSVETFNGTFDGRGYTLSNLAASGANKGLFQNLGAAGVIRNLKITNAKVSTYTAALVGAALYGTVEDVYVEGSITADGMGATSNLANFGCGLLAGRIMTGSQIKNVIVNMTSIKDGLRLGTAFGKLHGGAPASVFSGCYAVNAADTSYMQLVSNVWTKLSFDGVTNYNFDSLAALLADEDAKALAEKLGLAE